MRESCTLNNPPIGAAGETVLHTNSSPLLTVGHSKDHLLPEPYPSKLTHSTPRHYTSHSTATIPSSDVRPLWSDKLVSTELSRFETWITPNVKENPFFPRKRLSASVSPILSSSPDQTSSSEPDAISVPRAETADDDEDNHGTEDEDEVFLSDSESLSPIKNVHPLTYPLCSSLTNEIDQSPHDRSEKHLVDWFSDIRSYTLGSDKLSKTSPLLSSVTSSKCCFESSEEKTCSVTLPADRMINHPELIRRSTVSVMQHTPLNSRFPASVSLINRHRDRLFHERLVNCLGVSSSPGVLQLIGHSDAVEKPLKLSVLDFLSKSQLPWHAANRKNLTIVGHRAKRFPSHKHSNICSNASSDVESIPYHLRTITTRPTNRDTSDSIESLKPQILGILPTHFVPPEQHAFPASFFPLDPYPLLTQPVQTAQSFYCALPSYRVSQHQPVSLPTHPSFSPGCQIENCINSTSIFNDPRLVQSNTNLNSTPHSSMPSDTPSPGVFVDLTGYDVTVSVERLPPVLEHSHKHMRFVKPTSRQHSKPAMYSLPSTVGIGQGHILPSFVQPFLIGSSPVKPTQPHSPPPPYSECAYPGSNDGIDDVLFDKARKQTIPSVPVNARPSEVTSTSFITAMATNPVVSYGTSPFTLTTNLEQHQQHIIPTHWLWNSSSPPLKPSTVLYTCPICPPPLTVFQSNPCSCHSDPTPSCLTLSCPSGSSRSSTSSNSSISNNNSDNKSAYNSSDLYPFDSSFCTNRARFTCYGMHPSPGKHWKRRTNHRQSCLSLPATTTCSICPHSTQTLSWPGNTCSIYCCPPPSDYVGHQFHQTHDPSGAVTWTTPVIRSSDVMTASRPDWRQYVFIPEPIRVSRSRDVYNALRTCLVPHYELRNCELPH